ncbi:MAG: riboflavin biosynthesis protein RibF [Dehalococcoidia bacterium]|nr:riboflavin biosynthesis protein RibF [Dehalococcoidia bacterium]HCV00879.1 riboflavin biosynthesis protein RibF [Dehalococcoidia bacterium]
MTVTLPSLTLSQLEMAAPAGGSALVMGIFDGVHRGHQSLLSRLREEADARGLAPGVVTLHPHPVTVLRPDVAASYLTSLEDRLHLLRKGGASWVLPLTFTSELSEVTAEELAEAFQKLLHMQVMVLGPDAAFGRGAPLETPQRMRQAGEEFGFDVVQIEPLMSGDERCSSTMVRRALAKGDMEAVTQLLGRRYTLAGPVVRGFERGRTIGFPTANISVAADRALPELGVYATIATIAGRELLGATNIGRRPTFDAGHISIETHLLDFEGNLYDEHMEIEIVDRVRAEQTFSGPEELRAQIAEDVHHVRELLS